MEIKSILKAMCICLTIVSSNVSAQIFLDTHFTLNNYSDSYYSLSAYRGISDCCTSLAFEKEDKLGLYNYLGGFNYGDYSTLTTNVSTADVSFGYFLVENNDEFNATSIATGQFQSFATQSISTYSGSSTPIDLPFGVFYLGLALENNQDNEYTEFGWIQLLNSDTGLEMIRSAIAYGEGGITIGSTEQVLSTPIPSAAWLFGPALMFLIRRKGS